MTSERSTIRLLIEGRVQGVSFRAWAVAEARELGLDGWVRNRRDGQVELIASGPGDRLAILAARCHRGPPAAQVLAVRQTPWTEGVAPGFVQYPTV